MSDVSAMMDEVILTEGDLRLLFSIGFSVMRFGLLTVSYIQSTLMERNYADRCR